MAIRKRQINEADMTVEELALKWRREGGRAILVVRRDDGRWETSALRKNTTSTAACNVGAVGEPLDNVIRNLLCEKAASRKEYKADKQASHPAIKRLKLKQRTTGKT